LHRRIADEVGKRGRIALICGPKECALNFPGDGALIGITHARCRFNQRTQDRLQVERRPADYLEHVSSGCLLLKGFRQFFGPFLDLLEKACVFDRNYSLIGKGLD
jgi:hypothetical protein